MRQQLSPIRLRYDEEGRMKLPPKNRRGKDDGDDKEDCLMDLIGCSPDEADALVLAYYGMKKQMSKPRVGVMA